MSSQGPGAARVEQVILYRDIVTVEMSDGALCVGQRPGRATAWSGLLSGCPHPLPYSVTLDGPAPVRRVLAPGGSEVRIGNEGFGGAGV